ncbi:hypothetical protein BJ912DRAFT_81400 [Pholiota molesta]|nr:hypothetical protein BJ912DRAFT_81400 [Pholiota molesta]
MIPFALIARFIAALLDTLGCSAPVHTNCAWPSQEIFHITRLQGQHALKVKTLVGRFECLDLRVSFSVSGFALFPWTVLSTAFHFNSSLSSFSLLRLGRLGIILPSLGFSAFATSGVSAMPSVFTSSSNRLLMLGDLGRSVSVALLCPCPTLFAIGATLQVSLGSSSGIPNAEDMCYVPTPCRFVQRLPNIYDVL